MPPAASPSIIDATGTSELPDICRRNAAGSGTRRRTEENIAENPSRPIRGENPSRRPITWREYQPYLLLLLVSALFPMTMTRMRMLTIVRRQDLVRRRRMTTTTAAAAIAMSQTGGRRERTLPHWTTLGRVEAAADIAGPIRCRQDRQRGGTTPSEQPAASRLRGVHRNPPPGAVLRYPRAETQ
jgi:hypothetical protein